MKDSHSRKALSRSRASALQGVHSKRVVLLTKFRQCEQQPLDRRRTKKSWTGAPQDSTQKRSGGTKRKSRPQLLLSKTRNMKGSDFFTSVDIERALEQTTYTPSPSKAFYQKLRIPRNSHCPAFSLEPDESPKHKQDSSISVDRSSSVAKHRVRHSSECYNPYTLN